MGVVIRGSAAVRPTRWPLSHGARRLADAAIRKSLADAGRAASDVDMLVNAGVYRERGLGEPALAALIQEDVEANRGGTTAAGHGTFSFDVDNGACGPLTGVDVLRGFLSSGAIGLGIVVASDSGPGPRHARWYPRAETGAAWVLDHDPDTEGFVTLRFTTYPEYAELWEGVWRWERRRRRRHRHDGAPAGRNRLVVRERPGFRARATECAYESAGKLLADLGLGAGDVDLLIATPGRGMADPLADRLGISPHKVLHMGERLEQAHAAEVIAAVDVARRTGRWAEAHTVLLVCAGSGITVGTALYRH